MLLLHLPHVGMTLTHVSFDPSRIFDSVRADVLQVNDAFCEYSGYSREEILGMEGRKFIEIMHPLDIPKFLTKGWQLIKSGLKDPLTLIYRAKNGKGKYVKVKMISVGEKLADGSYLFVTNYYYPETITEVAPEEV